MQCAGIEQPSELVGPLGVAPDEEADAAVCRLLEDSRRVDVCELLADRERPVSIGVGGRLEVAQDLAWPELGDQPGDA